MENGYIRSIRSPKPLNRLSQNLAWVIISAMWPSTPKIQTNRPSGGVPAHGLNITLIWFLVFSFFVTTIFARAPRLNRKTDFLRCLIQRMSIPVYCIARGIKLQNVSNSLFLYQKQPQRGVNGIFKPNAQNFKTCIQLLLKLSVSFP